MATDTPPIAEHGVTTLPEQAWERARHRAKNIGPLTQWRPFEVLALAVQMQVLEAAATAIALIKSRTLFPRSALPIACPRKRQNLNPSTTGNGRPRPSTRLSSKPGTIRIPHARCSRWRPANSVTPNR